jgi:hypothetical protein
MGLRLSLSTLIKKKRKFFLIYKEIQKGAVAKSYMRKGSLIYKEMGKYLTIYEEAVSCMTLQQFLLYFLIYEEILFYFLSVCLLHPSITSKRFGEYQKNYFHNNPSQTKKSRIPGLCYCFCMACVMPTEQI